MPIGSSASLMTTGSKPSRSAMSAAIRSNVLAFVGVERQVVDALLGDHHELGEVDGVGAFAQDLALRTALAAGAQEGAHVLEVVGRDVAASVWVGGSGWPSRAKT